MELMNTMPNAIDLIEAIDSLLPQTQCGLCSYQGCRPYAEAIAHKDEKINRCPPGGLTVLHNLASLLAIDSEPLQDMPVKPAMQAKIREDECIGCTKCIQACPVDAISGSAKQMHVVLTSECTGCELCVAPCPVDCIDMLELSAPVYEPAHAKQRYQARQERLSQTKTPVQITQPTEPIIPSVQARQAAIQAALLRAKQKKQGLL
jgi:electron transport complex protein RnfB